MITRETVEQYKYPSFATEIAFEYKYQIAMETVKWNTSKQVSAKETALQNVYKYAKNFFFWIRCDFKETKSRKWSDGISGL